ncbi:adaptor complexe medium subunit family protein [Teladorsagia circumcincta]|uniref:Adaptor complexe medium subunit family protein n=1 Tax=Teladorsagia circumcincta TaxID=45464 RepID=A0A2G9UCK9_TELCI|nr:adaptor complexe medium subunit family protein [Teladorsagia circumcincta]
MIRAKWDSSRKNCNYTIEVNEEKKIKVSIPAKERAASRRRKSDMPYSDFYESISSQMPPQSRGCVSGRTTPLNDYEGDILEENPQYKNKAPPHPVVHRRTSIEWENFEEAKVDYKPSEEDEPMFSEDMSEERRRAQAAKFAAKEKEANDDVAKEEEASVEEHQATNGQHSAGEPESELETAVVNVEVTPALPSDPTTADTTTAPVAVQPTEVPEPVQPAEASEVENQEAAYDPNAYPGYIWNYETQQWDVDPNYDPSQHPASEYAYQYDGYGATTQGDGYGYPEGSYDQAYGQTYAYDQPDSYTSSTYPVGADASPYDQGSSGYPGYDQTTYAYDQPGSQAGYDTTAAAYDQQYTDAQGNGYVDTSYYGYNQNPVDYSEPPIGDPSATDYDTSATTTDISAGYGYEQPGYSDAGVAGTGGTTYDYSSASYGSSSAAPDVAVYAYDQGDTYGGTSATAAVVGQATDYSSYSHDYPTDYSNYQYPSEPAAQDYAESSQPEAGTSHPYPTQQLYQSVSEKPQPPPFTQPLFQSAPSSDLFAWDAVAHEPQAGGSTSQITEQHSPSRPPPPSRPAPPKHPRTGAGDEQVATAHLPPPRPPPASSPPASSPSAPPPRPGPPSPKPPTPRKVEPEPEPEEDAWTAFKKLTEKVNVAVKSTEGTLKTLSETTAAKDIKDESYLGQVGGTQGYVDNVAQREIHRLAEQKQQEKVLKKKLKQQGKKAASPTFDPDQEADMDRAAQQLAMKMASMRTDLGEATSISMSLKFSFNFRSSLKESQQDSTGSLELPAHLNTKQRDSVTPVGDLEPGDPKLTAPAWADFETSAPELPPSESGFFSNKDSNNANDLSTQDSYDPFIIPTQFKPERDPFAPPDKDLIDEISPLFSKDYDPFAVQPVEDIVAAAKAKAEEARLAKEAHDDVDFFGGTRQSPELSTPTPEGGSAVTSPSHRPDAFEDDFKCEGMDMETPTPLYDEDDSEPLTEFTPKFTGEGWDLMVRHPIKKKSFMAERFWKPCYVRLQGNTLLVYNAKTDKKPIQEKVGIRPGQITRLVDGHITKYGLPLEHTAQCTVLLKFGSLTYGELQSFVATIEDVLFKCPAKRDTKPVYKQDEVQIHCYDEYSAYVDKEGILSDQKARVRLFCLAFVSGSPFLEIGLNDRRRQGKEIVRRKDILPMYTERWIRFEEVEFHSTVDKEAFDSEQVIRLSPPDGCFFEVMRFRIRPPRNREKALTVKSVMKIAGSKNLKDRLLGAVQSNEANLIECAIGEAKYEHVYRSLVWRIPRIPEKHHAAYKSHLLRCRFELSSFDLMPDAFLPRCEVDFTMPLATVSNTVVRSVSVEQHEDSDRVEKFVRYVAKCQYKVEIDYVQCADLEIDTLDPSTNPDEAMNTVPELHQPAFQPAEIEQVHEGYRIEFNDAEVGRTQRDDSSSDDDDDKGHKMPIIQIDMKNYGY